MATWTDSDTISATIASTSKSSAGQFTIPANQRWTIYGVWGTSVGGTFQMEPSTIPSGKFTWQQNSTDQSQIGNTKPYATKIVLQGPVDIPCYFTNQASTSTANSTIQIMYEVTTGGQ